ncbi:MAG: DUF4185 domain-containing protein [Oscillospiraceae bacterium]|nr:DUF4185 domain-containing protein [Oscillospiraceae bacterium]
MKRRLIVMFLTAVLLLSGCGQNPEGPTDPTGSTDDTGGTNTVLTVPEDAFDAYSEDLLYVREVGKVTGETAFTNTMERFEVGATDLGFCYYDEELGRLNVIFGDTFANLGNSNWRSNVLLYTTQTDYSTGIAFTGALTSAGAAANGTAVQLTPNASRAPLISGDVQITPKTSTCIPTGAVMVGSTTYLYYMEIDENGFLDSGEWGVYCCRVLKSEDHGQTWTQVEGLTWQAKTEDGEEGVAPNFAQIYPLDTGDGYVYIYGIPGGRSGGTKLGRVEADKIEDFESYEYFTGFDADGNAKWRKGSSGLAYVKQRDSAYVIDMPCGEMCVTYNDYLGQYMALYQNGSSLVYRTSDTPYGPFSKPETILKTATDVYLGYGAFTCRQMADHGGQRIWILVSEWWPIYNVSQVEVVFK